MMIPNIAWRNIWRSKLRSFVVITAVALGVWAIITTLAFSNGFMVTFINNGIENQYSHIQIHHPDYSENQEVKYMIEEEAALVQTLKQTEHIKGFSGRLVVNGMLNTARGVKGLRFYGVRPADETKVTALEEKLVEGKYFEGTKKNPILISRRTAEDLRLKIRSKVVVTFQGADGEMVSDAFRVVGLLDTKLPQIDETRAFIRYDDLARLLQVENKVHEVAMFLSNPENVPEVAQKIQKQHAAVKVESWRELAPELDMIENQSNLTIYIIMGIILMALIFGIINTMLMAVLERKRELGMLMAVGMNKGKVFVMIVIETILLTLVGAPLGMFLGYLTVLFMNKKGLDLSSYGDGLQEFGMSDLVRPELDGWVYILLAVMVGVMAILASLYPAYKAIKLRPVEAIRSI